MAITPMRCPFNEKLCEECQLFRGRHYFLSTCEHYRGFIKNNTGKETATGLKTVDMAAMKKLFEPWSEAPEGEKASVTTIKVKVIDRETGTEQYCEHGETANWDWKNRSIMRTVGGRHVTSYEELLNVLRYQESKGAKELVIYVAPTFMVA